MEPSTSVREEQQDDKLTEVAEQEVWSWGAGTDGQLGTGMLQDELRPRPIRSLSSFGPISHLSCGGAHVIALTPGGGVLSWGRGTSGQLGQGEMVNSIYPKQVESLKDYLITHVSAGWNHSGFVSDTGCLFTCGDGSFGQLGHGDNQSQCYPVQVLYFNCRHVQQIACGMRHSVALLKGHRGDQVFCFGSGKRGQLGISEDKVRSVSLPEIALGLDDVEIVSVGANGDHSAALSVDGRLYTWGRGFSGASDAHKPLHVAASSLFFQVALGWNHALALTGDGKVSMLGGDHHGALGETRSICRMKHSSELKQDVVRGVPDLDGTQVLQIAAGAEHSAVVTENGAVMTWGWGEHGQLGLGDTEDQIAPQVVNLDRSGQVDKHSISRVYCGSGFTFVLRTQDVHSEP